MGGWRGDTVARGIWHASAPGEADDNNRLGREALEVEPVRMGVALRCHGERTRVEERCQKPCCMAGEVAWAMGAWQLAVIPSFYAKTKYSSYV
jgi:hypothetical protein